MENIDDKMFKDLFGEEIIIGKELSPILEEMEDALWDFEY